MKNNSQCVRTMPNLYMLVVCRFIMYIFVYIVWVTLDKPWTRCGTLPALYRNTGLELAIIGSILVTITISLVVSSVLTSRTMKISPLHFAFVSGPVTVLFLVCLPLPHWMAVVGEKDVGPWNQEGHSSDKYYSSKCSNEMSLAECGYLKSLQVSSVLTVLFGFFSTLVYFIPPRNTNEVSFFLATSGNVVQCVMALMTLVIFSYFKKHYFDDDGINQEYPQPDETSYSVVFWLWMTGLLVLSLSTVTSYYVARASTYSRKGMLNLDK